MADKPQQSQSQQVREERTSMKLTIFGATGRTGREFVTQALDAGHDVTVLVRSAAKLGELGARVTVVQGDVTDPDSVNRAVAGSEAVISALGHVRGSTDDVLTVAASNIIAAMHRHRVRRLVVLAPPSVSDPGDRPRFLYRLVGAALPLFMRQLTRDHRAQARLVEESGLDWTIVRGAPQFTDGPHTGRYHAGPINGVATASISRADLADFMLAVATSGKYIRSLPLVSQ